MPVIAPETRRRYLNAMGVDLWVRRGDETPASFEEPLSKAPEAGRQEGGERLSALAELGRVVADCRLCGLHATRRQTVFGVGAEDARCMVIGEAPGAEEDRRGEPFVGRAGRLLNAMLRAMGLERGDVYIANIIKCRPPDNRDPRPEEVAACGAYLRRQIELVDPVVILAVGRVAAQNLLGTSIPIGKMRGRDYRHGETGIPVVVTYHPAYLLRSPLEKRKAWEDLRRALALLESAA